MQIDILVRISGPLAVDHDHAALLVDPDFVENLRAMHHRRITPARIDLPVENDLANLRRIDTFEDMVPVLVLALGGNAMAPLKMHLRIGVPTSRQPSNEIGQNCFKFLSRRVVSRPGCGPQSGHCHHYAHQHRGDRLLPSFH